MQSNSVGKRGRAVVSDFAFRYSKFVLAKAPEAHAMHPDSSGILLQRDVRAEVSFQFPGMKIVRRTPSGHTFSVGSNLNDQIAKIFSFRELFQTSPQSTHADVQRSPVDRGAGRLRLGNR